MWPVVVVVIGVLDEQRMQLASVPDDWSHRAARVRSVRTHTAVIAALRGRGGIAAGDAIGANITMLTLVLGLAVVMRPIPVGGKVGRYLIAAAALGGVAALILLGGVGRPEGLILISPYVIAVAVVWITERKRSPSPVDSEASHYATSDYSSPPSPSVSSPAKTPDPNHQASPVCGQPPRVKSDPAARRIGRPADKFNWKDKENVLHVRVQPAL